MNENQHQEASKYIASLKNWLNDPNVKATIKTMRDRTTPGIPLQANWQKFLFCWNNELLMHNMLEANRIPYFLTKDDIVQFLDKGVPDLATVMNLDLAEKLTKGFLNNPEDLLKQIDLVQQIRKNEKLANNIKSCIENSLDNGDEW